MWNQRSAACTPRVATTIRPSAICEDTAVGSQEHAALWQMGVVEITNSNPQGALDPLNKGLTLAIQVENQEQRALIQQSIGVCYRF